MITTTMLVAILIKVMLIVTTNPNIPQDVKDSVVMEVMTAISTPETQEVKQPIETVKAVPVNQPVVAVPVSYSQAELYTKSSNVLDFKMNDADRVEYTISWGNKSKTKGYAIPVGGDNTIEVKNGDGGTIEVISYKNKQEIGRFTREIMGTEIR